LNPFASSWILSRCCSRDSATIAKKATVKATAGETTNRQTDQGQVDRAKRCVVDRQIPARPHPLPTSSTRC
jgi:hypothetical protein